MTDVWTALGDKNTRVVAQIAPAVRVAVGEAFGMREGKRKYTKPLAPFWAEPSSPCVLTMQNCVACR